jgi:hypothetical protein
MSSVASTARSRRGPQASSNVPSIRRAVRPSIPSVTSTSGSLVGLGTTVWSVGYECDRSVLHGVMIPFCNRRLMHARKQGKYVQFAACSGANWPEMRCGRPDGAACRTKSLLSWSTTRSGRCRRSAAWPTDLRYGVQWRQQLGDVVTAVAGQRDSEQIAVRVDDQVCMEPGWPRLTWDDPTWTPVSAWICEASTPQRSKSNKLAARSSASSTSCNAGHTPVSGHDPANTARSSTGVRSESVPPWWSRWQ